MGSSSRSPSLLLLFSLLFASSLFLSRATHETTLKGTTGFWCLLHFILLASWLIAVICRGVVLFLVLDKHRLEIKLHVIVGSFFFKKRKFLELRCWQLKSIQYINFFFLRSWWVCYGFIFWLCSVVKWK